MPSAPTFDYYSTLEVESTATPQEITASYRRLALIHHPDRNPGNAEAATATFQKIQLAHETLSDPAKRAEYDDFLTQDTASDSTDSYTPSSPFFDSFTSDEVLFAAYFHGYGVATFGPGAREPTERERVAEKAAKEAAEKRLMREAEAAARKKSRDDAKKAEEELKAEEKEKDRVVEKHKQEARWETLGARTKDERVDTCLHSSFCTKVTQKQKFKCPTCHVKRGMIAFQCPHCELSICQQCVTDYGKIRLAAEKEPSHKPEPAAEPASDRRTATEPESERSDGQESEPQPELKSKPKPSGKTETEFVQRPAAEKEKETAEAGDDKKTTNAKSKHGKGNQKKRPGQRRCYECHKTGHLARACPNRGKKSKEEDA
ncbi:DnaJ-domain-containing protein [Hypomontagnella submonticulosa]|nr:DnaJ-domain-containing protein [Hypomontagnella submonticulosa]